MNTLPEAPGLFLIAGLICFTVGACCFIAFLITATIALCRRNR